MSASVVLLEVAVAPKAVHNAFMSSRQESLDKLPWTFFICSRQGTVRAEHSISTRKGCNARAVLV
eukprot:4208723-Karenia_brevis.AAC.1